jgi:hypothetical protein
MKQTMDDDELQEYRCLMLEGFSEKEARSKARSANNKVNSKRLSGPTTGNTRLGHGERPLISDLFNVDLYDTATPVTQDTRSVLEREQDWARQDTLRTLLEHCTDIQRSCLTALYGLESGEPMTYLQVAQLHGFGHESWTRKTRARALNRIRKALTQPSESARLEYRRQLKREQMRRYRARKATT